MVGKLIPIFLIAASAAFAQHISVGFLGGVPFTGGFSVFTTDNALLNEVEHSYSNSNEFIIGPMVEVRLPLSLAIEVDALYRPVSTATNVIVGTGSSQVTVTSSSTFSSWEFPVLGKYRFALPIISP